LCEEEEDDDDRLGGGKARWIRGRWWYKLTHVCQRWRNLILGSTSYLDLCLVCAQGTPVADMLAHSPPLPLIVDHVYGDVSISEEDEEGILLALKQYCDRVRCVRLQMAIPNLQKLVVAIDEEFPILEHLILMLP